MKLIDTLRKLGIVRFGANSSVYHNAKDRPLEFQSDDIYNAKKDTVTKDEAKKVASAATAALKVRPSKIGNVFFVSSIIAAILFMFLALASKVWWLLILIWITWVTLLWLIRRGKVMLRLRFGLIFAILAVFSLFLVVLTVSDSNSSSKSSSTSDKNASKKLTSAECQPYVQKYNNKVLKISSYELQGTVGIKIDATNGCQLKGWYNVLLSNNLPQNPYKRDIGGAAYHYVILLRDKDETTRTKYDELGELSAVYKNSTTLPDAFADSKTRAALYSQNAPAAVTSYFSWGYQIDTEFSEARYQEILSKTKFEIVNGTPFIEEKPMSAGGYSWSVNGDEAAINGEIVKTYSLTITE